MSNKKLNLPGDIRLWVAGIALVLLVQPLIKWTYSLKAVILIILCGAVQLYFTDTFSSDLVKMLPVVISAVNAGYGYYVFRHLAQYTAADGPDLIIRCFIPFLTTLLMWLGKRKK